MVGFSGILGTGSVEDQKMIKDNKRKKIVSRFRGKLVVNMMTIQFRLKLENFIALGL